MRLISELAYKEDFTEDGLSWCSLVVDLVFMHKDKEFRVPSAMFGFTLLGMPSCLKFFRISMYHYEACYILYLHLKSSKDINDSRAFYYFVLALFTKPL